MSTLPALKKPAVFWLSCVALIVAALLLSNGLLNEAPRGAVVPPTQEVLAREGGAVVAGSAAGGGSRASASASDPCEYFFAWNELECAPDGVASFFERGESLDGLDLSCIGSEWLMLALFMQCEGTLRLPKLDAKLISAEVSQRLPDPINVSESPIGAELSPSTLPCFISSILPFGATGEEVGEAWAWGLMAMFGDKGSIFEADPEVVAALVELMAHWPLENDQWWAHLWAALPEGVSLPSVYMRIALYEALHETLSEGDWLQRLSLLVELEQNDYSGSVGVWAVGDAIERHLSSDDIVSLLALYDNPQWVRAVIFAFPGDRRWPATGSVLVPDYVKEALIELIDSDEYRFQEELLGKQWTLLGPKEALADLERFVLDSVRSSEGWGVRASARVSAAIVAIQVSSPIDGDAALLEQARSMVRELFFSSSLVDSQRILDGLRYEGVIPFGTDSEWKKNFVEVLGQGWVMGLDPKYQAWLEVH